jgi:uncharacterized membrane protein
MASTEKSIEVNVPVSTAYNQWTQFESFPKFMEHVEEVRQLDDRRLHWRAKIAGKEVEWDAEITEQIPDERIAWKSTTGATNAGVVTFHRLDEGVTKVMLQLDTDTDDMSLVEKVGDKLGLSTSSAEGDLKRFKEFIESQGQETGAWRGEVGRPTP